MNFWPPTNTADNYADADIDASARSREHDNYYYGQNREQARAGDEAPASTSTSTTAFAHSRLVEHPSETPERPQWKQDIIDDFTAWLDALPETPERAENGDDCESSDPDSFEQTDWNTLLRELTALRQEVKLQSRGNAKIGDSISKLAAELSDELSHVKSMTAAVKDEIPKARRDAERAAIMPALEVFEAIQRCQEIITKTKIPRLALSSKARRRHEQNIVEPVRILKSKLDEFMRRMHLEPVAETGMSFSADSMHVLGTSTSGAPKNTVTKVLSQGYRLRGSLLKTAEVHVEK